MSRYFFLLLLSSFSCLPLFGQSIWTNPINGSNPSADNPFTAGQTVNANLTVSGIGRGSGITANAGGDRYNATGWSLTSLDLNDYFYFTLTPNSGFQINLVSFVYNGQRSGTGPNNFVFRSSLDNYSANIGSPTATGVTIDLTGSQFQNVAGSITFRFYGYGGTAAAGTFSINDFIFNGTLTSIPMPINVLSFTGKSNDNSNELQWMTSDASGFSHFEVERSWDGVGFETISSVNPGENKNGRFSFIDDGIAQRDKSFYRLRLVDNDASFSYTKTIVIRKENKTVSLHFDNQTRSLYLSGSDMPQLIYITDINGNMVKRVKAADTIVDLSALRTGIYFAYLGESQNANIIKFFINN